MIVIAIHEAKTHFSRWVNRALAGEDVVVARGSKPVVRLTPILDGKVERRIGSKPGFIVEMSDDFDASLDDFEGYMP